MQLTSSNTPQNGHPYLHDGHPADEVAKEVMSRLAAQALHMAASGLQPAMQEPLEEEEEALDFADDEHNDQ